MEDAIREESRAVLDDFFAYLDELAATDFEKRLASAAVENLLTPGPLRLNNFAYAIRELLREIFCRLASDHDVLNCTWFPDDRRVPPKVQRRDRMRYIIQGGMSDWAAKNFLGSDPERQCVDLIRTIEGLSKYTHVSEQSFDAPAETIDSMVQDCVTSLAELVEEMVECRRTLAELLDSVCDAHITEQFLHETHQNLDELSTHHWVDEYDIQGVSVRQINYDWVYLDVNGSVTVGMQYGSNSDCRRGDGVRTSLSWPFSGEIRVQLVKPLGSKSELLSFDVDTSEWCE